MPTELETTRRHLHGVAELLVAGPQHRLHGTIRLAADPRGVRGVVLPVAIEGTDLVWPDGRTPLAGTVREIAAIANIEPGAPEGLYSDTSGLDLDQSLDIDPASAGIILGWFDFGDRALRSFASEETPVLWPEHFDLGISVDEVNYGVSPGDADQPQPYAYIGPWTPRSGPFWNAPFGAIRAMDDFAAVEDLVEFFVEGSRQADR